MVIHQDVSVLISQLLSFFSSCGEIFPEPQKNRRKMHGKGYKIGATFRDDEKVSIGTGTEIYAAKGRTGQTAEH
ncbi:hypothetical protein SPBRAN_1302 [uncultured Candidatus Thioglobus sp.]|nr:hypothetical protein SPBRAN_1302 [uncultured Candidatus Thioglobus sp.]